jgi:hypothetical protein
MNGLSSLQRTVLERAFLNYGEGLSREIPHIGIVDVFACEVAHDYFEWPPAERLPGAIPCRKPPDMDSREANRVHAAICRTFKRLEERGLGIRVSGQLRLERWSGFRLSEDCLKRKAMWRSGVWKVMRSQGMKLADVQRIVERHFSGIGRD